MQRIRLGNFTAVLVMTLLGWGGGCNKDKDSDSAGPEGQDCQGPNIANAKYICPEGFFCKYVNEQNMQNPHELGKCRAMEQYQPCMSITLCDSQYSPKCETANETAYCDWLQTTKRCRCDKPGPFTPVDGEADGGDVKTPTTTK